MRNQASRCATTQPRARGGLTRVVVTWGLGIAIFCLSPSVAGAEETPAGAAPTTALPPGADEAPPADGGADGQRLEVPASRFEGEPSGTEGAAPQELAPVEILAPRLFAGPSAGPAPRERAVTPARTNSTTFDQPAAVSVIERGDLRYSRAVRSLSGALEGIPGTLVQKTAPMQHSPFIRGFTGYQNVLLIDGIRLNHSAFRAGPNQYWSTIDTYGIARLEVVRGPQGVLYGSDAVGGVVNAIPAMRDCRGCGARHEGRLAMRYATAEDALFLRAEAEGHRGALGWIGGVTRKTYGTLESGGGRLPGTGGTTEWDGDLRFDWQLSRPWTLTLAWQHVRQFDAPRTERTLDSVPFAGTEVGSELRRDFDQERDLVYARLAFDRGMCCRPISSGRLTFSWHRHGETRDRLRSGDRRDVSGFELQQWGAQLELVSRLSSRTSLTYGASWYHDVVESHRRDFVGGVLTRTQLQGPLGDDATYDLASLFAQAHHDLGRLDLYAGARFTYAAADADRVDDPTNPSLLDEPGNVIGVSNDWTNVVGSLRAVYAIDRQWNAFAGVSQGFRAPSLHDLTSLDSSSVVETPSPSLDAEDYLAFEVGLKTEQKALRGSLSVWMTRLYDTIVRSPTGALIDGVPEVRKDNIGDGYVWGVDLDGAWQVCPSWLVYGTLSTMDGEVDQLDEMGDLVRAPLSRMKPFSTLLGVRHQRPGSRWWIQADWRHSAREDRLSFRDRSDSRRIPPGGTPGYDVLGLRMGYRLGRRTHVSLGLENLLDEDYRVHGSGQNEPGFGAVFAAEVGF